MSETFIKIDSLQHLKPDWSDLRDLNFDCIQFRGFRSWWCNVRSSLRCPCTIDWQFSRPARLIFLSGASRPIGNIRTHRIRVETISGGLACRRSLTPRVSSSRAPVLSLAHFFQAPGPSITKHTNELITFTDKTTAMIIISIQALQTKLELKPFY